MNRYTKYSCRFDTHIPQRERNFVFVVVRKVLAYHFTKTQRREEAVTNLCCAEGLKFKGNVRVAIKWRNDDIRKQWIAVRRLARPSEQPLTSELVHKTGSNKVRLKALSIAGHEQSAAQW